MTDNQALAADAQDQVRAYRLFAGMASTALGITPDQSGPADDIAPANEFGMHTVSDPYRGTAVQGKAFVQMGGSDITSGMLLLGALVVFVLMHRKG